jgi:hypothetical protein
VAAARPRAGCASACERVSWAEEENGARWGNGAPRATVSGACPSDQCQRIGFRGRAPRGRVAGVA